MPSGRGQVLHDDIELASGTLAANTAIAVESSVIRNENQQGFRIGRFKYWQSYNGKTAGEGPIMVGVSVGLTAAEITECILARPLSDDDTDASDKANRKVYPLYIIAADGDEKTASNSTMNAQHIRFPWKEIPEHVSIDWWMMSDTAVTSGLVVDIRSVFVGEWLRD